MDMARMAFKRGVKASSLLHTENRAPLSFSTHSEAGGFAGTSRRRPRLWIAYKLGDGPG